MAISVLTYERAKSLLSAYGANPARWPTDERDAMHAALLQWPDLQQWVAAEQRLDGQLLASEVPRLVTLDSVLSRIDQYPLAHESVPTSTNNDPEQAQGGAVTGLGSAWQWWKIALAACVPLALGVGLGMSSIEISDDWQGSEHYLFAPSYEEFING